MTARGVVIERHTGRYVVFVGLLASYRTTEFLDALDYATARMEGADEMRRRQQARAEAEARCARCEDANASAS